MSNPNRIKISVKVPQKSESVPIVNDTPNCIKISLKTPTKLDMPIVEPCHNKSLMFSYNHETKLDNKNKQVNKVTFDISRYGKYEESLTFNDPITIKNAISNVEKYLSQPLTYEYYERIKDDLFSDAMEFVDAIKYYECRGEALTDNRFLESVQITDGHLTFCCGS